jgi:acylphosphatase
VQAVGFRAFVWREASARGIIGWARNCYDGTVEVLAQAPDEILDDFHSRLQEGPRLSRVDRVEVSDEPEPADVGSGFGVRPDA